MIKQADEYKVERGYLTGKLLIAMPYAQDTRFYKTVIYVCGHDDSGAMGLIINKPLATVSFKELLMQMEIDIDNNLPNVPIHYGGPVEVGRGFVLHTADYLAESSVIINDNFALTATLEILRAISHQRGPDKAILALGYVGWGAFQLETEVQNNGWLLIDATPEIVFNSAIEGIWEAAMASIGVNPTSLNIDSGHA